MGLAEEHGTGKGRLVCALVHGGEGAAVPQSAPWTRYRTPMLALARCHDAPGGAEHALVRGCPHEETPTRSSKIYDDGGAADPACVGDTVDAPGLDEAQRMFYNGRYADAVALTADLCTAEADDLAACELRTSALLFQLRRALGDSPDKDKAFSRCAACPALLSTLMLVEIARRVVPASTPPISIPAAT